MKVILNENVSNLGTIGDIVNVKQGYARNFLIPRGMACLANESNQKSLNHQLAVLDRKKQKAKIAAEEMAKKINGVSVTLSKPVGEDERIFGTVTTAELSQLLKDEGITLDRKQIHLTEDIKKVGVFSADVDLHPEVKCQFKVWVVAQ